MADVVKTQNVLSLVAAFTDGDDRTINLDNPVANVSASAIKAVGTLAKSVLIGDKAGAGNSSELAFRRYGLLSASRFKRTLVYPCGRSRRRYRLAY